MKHTLTALLPPGPRPPPPPPPASAQETSATAAKKQVKKPVKKASKKTKPADKHQHAATPASEDDAEPDIADSKSVDFQCELGNKLTIYENANDDKHIAIRWKKRLSRLTRGDTTTGAIRFENRSQGLVWIGIPAKSMLLDAKKGHQLANECKNAEQLKPLQASAQSTQENAAAQTAATSPDIKAAKI